MDTAAPLPEWPPHPRRSRIRGWIWKSVGVISFALIFLWPIVFMAAGLIPPEDLTSFQDGGFELGMFFFGLIGVKCYMRGKRHFAIAATELLSKDPRPPVIYLRSFQHDKKGAGSAAGSRFWGGWQALFDLKTVEERLAEALTPIGPVIAIGKPGEKLPALGAARLYVGDDEWQKTIRGLMTRSRLVVLLLGDTPGFWWELERSVKDLPPERLVLLVPFRRKRYDAFREQAASHFAHPLPEYSTRAWWPVPLVLMGLAAAAGAPFGTDPMIGSAMLAGLVSLGFRPRRGLGKLAGLIYFKSDWTSEWVDLTKFKPVKGFRLNFYGHHRMKKSFGWNLRPVFEQLALEWKPPKMRKAYLAVVASFLALIILGGAGLVITSAPELWRMRRETAARRAARDGFLARIRQIDGAQGQPEDVLITQGRRLAREGMARIPDTALAEYLALVARRWSNSASCVEHVLSSADPHPSETELGFMPPSEVEAWYRLLGDAATAYTQGVGYRDFNPVSPEALHSAYRAYGERYPTADHGIPFFIVRQRTSSAAVREFLEGLGAADPFGYVQTSEIDVCNAFASLHANATALPSPHNAVMATALALSKR